MTKNTIILVHPLMSVNLTFLTLKAHGFKIFTIETNIEQNKINKNLLKQESNYYFKSSSSVENDYKQIQALINENNLNVVAVINGIDASLYYTDYLVSKLIKNSKIDLNYSNIRLNKYLVHQIMEENNIHTIPSCEVTTTELNNKQVDIIKALGWPVVIKPSENTASMAGFYIANNLSEIQNYLAMSLGSKNTYYQDCIIEKLVIQKYIPINTYDEFVVDFLSYNGKHYLQGIVVYDKEIHKNEVIYRTYRPLTLTEIPKIEIAIGYLRSILDALKVNYGFTHNEIFWDQNDSFYLIESNNRMAGGGIVDAYQKCYGYTPLESFLSVAENKPIDDNYPNHRESYSLCMHLYNFYQDNPQRINVEDVPSFQSIVSFYPKNKTPMNFENYTRAEHITATILLNNKNKEELQKDMDEIINREKSGKLFI